MALRRIEEEILLGLDCQNHVIATGGSAAYSHAAMTHLKSDGLIVFLDADLPTLESRINDFDKRGLAKRPEQSFAELFEERFALYVMYADVNVKCAGLTQEAVCAEMINQLGTGKSRRFNRHARAPS
jgi:shikimate kinase